MNTPTPNPRQEWITVAGEAIQEAARSWARVDLSSVYRDEIVAAGLRAALAKVAYEIRAELVCCDVYDRDANTDRAGERHAICFWGEAAARIVEQRPDAPAVRPVEPSAVPVEGWRQHALADKAYKALRESPVPAGGSGHPQPATGEMWCVCGAPDSGPCGRCVPDTGRPVLSLDTPEGATTPRSRLDRMRVAPGVYCADPNCQLHPHAEGATTNEH